MKTRIPSRSTGLLRATGLSLLAGLCVHASDGTSTASVKLSTPDKPATLRIDMPWADIHIAGVNGDTVTVESSLAKKTVGGNHNDGLRRLDDEVNFDLNEHDNQVRLTLAGENPWEVHDGDFRISVPRTIALAIKTEAGGDLDIKNVTGDIEINAMNGEVRLEGLAGSAVINTMNGEVRATYAQVPQKLVSITSMNGAISLRVPAETKANVRLRNQNGAIFTDFDEKALQTKSQGIPDLTNILITVLNNGEYMLGDNPATISADELANALTKISASQLKPKVTIRSEENVNLKYARTSITIAMDACRKVGLNKIQLQAVLSPPSADVAFPSPPPHPPLSGPITGGKLVSGTLNGGGVDIKISTMNGQITLRRTNPTATTPAPNTTTPEQVTVVFQDPDNFTDIRESHSNMNSTADLEELRNFVRKTAEPRLAAGTTLTITFLDLDFAGEIRPDKDNIRVMTAVTPPRAQIKFELRGTNGEIIRKGERKLSDMNYQQSVSHMGRDDPLSYEKQLLKDWITREFNPKS
ncbi:MAG TPA: DUF3016 domain-containing protein [Lacunisphaera sp.]|jgi:biopolymer transport protein ExbD